MNSSIQAKLVLLPLIISLILLLIAPASESAISCGTVISSIKPCLSYLQGTGGKPPKPCCDGCQSLASSATSAADKQAACTCLKNASQKININSQLALNFLRVVESLCPSLFHPMLTAPRSIEVF